MTSFFNIMIGFFTGFGMLVLLLWHWVTVPPECGEPAACGDDHLFPALWVALVLWVVFTAAAIYFRRVPFWRFALAQSVAALLIALLSQLLVMLIA